MRKDYLDMLVKYLEEYEKKTHRRVESILQVYFILASAQRKRKINVVVDYDLAKHVFHVYLSKKLLVHA